AETTAETTGDGDGDGDCEVISVEGWIADGGGAAGVIAPNIGGSETDAGYIEFYPAAAVGDFDLGSEANLNYASCSECVRVFEDFDGSTIARQYFQESGTLSITDAT